MKCEEDQEQLQLYLDDVLAKQERRALKAHLAKCPHCRAELQLLRGIVEAVETEPLLEPRADFTSQVMTELPELGRRKLFSSANIFLASGVAAAFVVAVWLSLSYGSTLAATIEEQVSIFSKTGRWLLLALHNFDYSKSFSKVLSTITGSVVSLGIYQLVSSMYSALARKSGRRLSRHSQSHVPV